MDSTFRKISIRAVDKESGFQDVVRADLVRDIYDLNGRFDTQDHTFHNPGEGIRNAKVRRERYNHFFSVGLPNVPYTGRRAPALAGRSRRRRIFSARSASAIARSLR